MVALTDAGRLTFIVTADAVGPGMLTWPAWQAARDAGEVLGRDVDPRWVQAFADAGVVVRDVPEQAVSELAQRLVNGAREGRHLVWFVSRDGDPGLAEAVTAAVVRAGNTPGDGASVNGGQDLEVEMVLGSYEDFAGDSGVGQASAGGVAGGIARPGGRLLDLVDVMDRLRSPGGCPWDAAQTHGSLVPYALEEAFELAEAIEAGDREHLREELGDLLLQVVFHARVATEDDVEPFDIDDVAAGIVEKLKRRHPHVFGAPGSPGGDASTPEEVDTSWHAIKAAEKGRASVLDGVPLALPALARAEKVLGRIERAGLQPPPGGGTRVASSEELGERLLELVVAAREAGLDPEAALRAAVRDLEERARAAERA